MSITGDEVDRCVLKVAAEEKCQSSCVKEMEAYNACVKRIEGSTVEGANCEAWYFDYQKCIDKCALPIIWSQLK